jgi:hypothetical protein
MKLAVAIALAGCSVPDVDLAGKHCPCSSAYVCDEATQRCVRAGSDAAVDSPGDGSMAQSCLGSDPTSSPVFTDTFNNLVNWAIPAGIWTANGGEALSAKTDTYTYAYPILLTPKNDYRVVTTVRQVEHTDMASAYEIAFRIQVGGELLHCNWEPNDHHIVLQHTNAGGTTTNVLMDQIVSVPASFDPNKPVTLELQVVGGMVRCCVRELPGSLVQFAPLSLPSGPPGIKTWKMTAAYNDFAMY